jgi:hypothetical protein
MAVSEGTIATAAANLKEAENKLSKLRSGQVSSTSRTDLPPAEQRRDEYRNTFNRLYDQYCSEMERAGQTPKSASYWPH